MIVSLVLLVAITLIGVYVMSGSHLEWLMSSNSRFQTDAELRAEAALLEGEDDVKTNVVDPTAFDWTANDVYYNDLDPLYALNPDPRDIANWTTATFNTAPAASIPPAKYVIEYVGCVYVGIGTGCDPCGPAGAICYYTYRIWAYAADSKGASRIVQSTLSQKAEAPNPPSAPFRIAFAQIDHDQPPNP